MTFESSTVFIIDPTYTAYRVLFMLNFSLQISVIKVYLAAQGHKVLVKWSNLVESSLNALPVSRVHTN